MAQAVREAVGKAVAAVATHQLCARAPAFDMANPLGAGCHIESAKFVKQCAFVVLCAAWTHPRKCSEDAQRAFSPCGMLCPCEMIKHKASLCQEVAWANSEAPLGLWLSRKVCVPRSLSFRRPGWRKFGHCGPTLAELGPNLADSWPSLAELWRISTTSRSKSAHLGANLAESGRHSDRSQP